MFCEEAAERWHPGRAAHAELRVAGQESSHYEFAPSLAPTIYCPHGRIAACLAASELGARIGGGA